MENSDNKTFNDFGSNKQLSYEIIEPYMRFSFHYGCLYLYYFKETYSSFSVTADDIDKKKFIAKLSEKYSLHPNRVISSELISQNDFDKINDTDTVLKAFIIIKHGLAVGLDYDRVIVMYNTSALRDEAVEITKMAGDFVTGNKKNKEFYMISRNDAGTDYSLKNFELKNYNTNIEDNYNDDFQGIHRLIEKTISENKSNGIILLHGIYGSGKTYYIRHLIGSSEKKFIYIPHHTINWLTSPDFLPFMVKQQKAAIIIEDCESILLHREDGNNNAEALSNLLNLGDGLLSDALSLNIICSFNANIRKIDDALLRKGRLIARYEFKELEIPKAQKLADKLQKNISVQKPMSLADIYNAENISFENKKERKIGFALT